MSIDSDLQLLSFSSFNPFDDPVMTSQLLLCKISLNLQVISGPGNPHKLFQPPLPLLSVLIGRTVSKFENLYQKAHKTFMVLFSAHLKAPVKRSKLFTQQHTFVYHLLHVVACCCMLLSWAVVKRIKHFAQHCTTL